MIAVEVKVNFCVTDTSYGEKTTGRTDKINLIDELG